MRSDVAFEVGQRYWPRCWGRQWWTKQWVKFLAWYICAKNCCLTLVCLVQIALFACVDSYLFTSVGAAKELYRNGLRFIGVVKTATRGFPKAFLASVELNQRGDFFAFASDSADELDPAMAAFVWMDRERRYFITTAGRGSLGRNAIHSLPMAASKSRSECSSGAGHHDHQEATSHCRDLLYYLWCYRQAQSVSPRQSLDREEDWNEGLVGSC